MPVNSMAAVNGANRTSPTVTDTDAAPTVPAVGDAERLDCDVLVIGGGTAGVMAALTAAQEGADVLLLEKAHVRHSGALAMGMDGVNNAVIPGKAVPEDYVAEITRANDGIVDQRTVMQTATRGFSMVKRLESYGVKFEKDEYGDYAVRRVHRSGSYVLPMPEGKDIKKALYRQLRRKENRRHIRIENRFMPVRVLVGEDGRACGAAAFNTRTGEFVTVGAKSVILATGPCGRLGLPASGYLYGTYENPTNAGDGYSMAYHAGAELSGIECFQINPLIKDYNGPACAYVANPFGGYQVNADGDRFVDSDYWSGQMIKEVAGEIESAKGPIYLKVSHLPEETVSELESILHSTERPTRSTFHANRGHDYRTHDIEMHVSEIGLCSGHSASGVAVDDHGRTTVPGLYAAGDLACVPHNYMIGAFVYGELTGRDAALTRGDVEAPGELPAEQVREAHELIYRPYLHPDGPPQPQVEYKLRRFVNDYVAPPKTSNKLELAVETFERMRLEIEAMGGRTPHELMRCAEVNFIRDCAEMAARSSLTRQESRWGLYHERADLPGGQRDEEWGFHLNLFKDEAGEMAFLKRPVHPYLVPVEEFDHIPSPDDTVVPVTAPVVRTPFDAGAVRGRAVARSTEGAGAQRILELLAIEDPQADELAVFLDDPEPRVRTAAIASATENTPDGFGRVLLAALGDSDAEVRRQSVKALRELVEILPRVEDAGVQLEAPDPAVRTIALHLMRVQGTGSPSVYRDALADTDLRVRLEAVAALTSVDDAAGVSLACADAEREVRVVAAKALGTIASADSEPVLLELGGDVDPLVREAALAALGSVGRAGGGPGAGDGAGEESVRARMLTESLGHPSWRVRVGSVKGAASLDAGIAVALLRRGLSDENADVRKAVVTTAATWPGDPSVREVLVTAQEDSDADVRAYARIHLEAGEEVEAGVEV